jgi:hypothetical protein
VTRVVLLSPRLLVNCPLVPHCSPLFLASLPSGLPRNPNELLIRTHPNPSPSVANRSFLVSESRLGLILQTTFCRKNLKLARLELIKSIEDTHPVLKEHMPGVKSIARVSVSPQFLGIFWTFLSWTVSSLYGNIYSNQFQIFDKGSQMIISNYIFLLWKGCLEGRRWRRPRTNVVDECIFWEPSFTWLL